MATLARRRTPGENVLGQNQQSQRSKQSLTSHGCILLIIFWLELSKLQIVALIYFTRTRLITSYLLTDPSSGSSVDMAYDHGVKHTFALELRDTGKYGFLLPADQITPSGEETWAGIIAAILAVWSTFKTIY